MAAALSQDALADRAGLSLRGVTDLERGVRRAPVEETMPRGPGEGMSHGETFADD